MILFIICVSKTLVMAISKVKVKLDWVMWLREDRYRQSDHFKSF